MENRSAYIASVEEAPKSKLPIEIYFGKTLPYLIKSSNSDRYFTTNSFYEWKDWVELAKAILVADAIETTKTLNLDSKDYEDIIIYD